LQFIRWVREQGGIVAQGVVEGQVVELGEGAEGLGQVEQLEGAGDCRFEGWAIRVVTCPIVYPVLSFEFWVQVMKLLIVL